MYTCCVWIYKGEFKLDEHSAYVTDDEYLKQVKIGHKEEARRKKYQKKENR